VKIKPKNWQAFQHYKDGTPVVWIKLYKKLLDDFEFQSMPVASRALAPMLWLMATEHPEGVIDADPDRLTFRLRWTGSAMADALSPLIGKGFFEVVQFPATEPMPSLEPVYKEPSPYIKQYKAEDINLEDKHLLSGKPDDARLGKRKAQVKTEALQYLDFLNAKAGKHFRPVPSNLRLIEARLSEGVSLQDLKTLTVRKCREWLGTDQEKYLRPETLCNATKCHSYLGEIPPEDQSCNVPDVTEASDSAPNPVRAAGNLQTSTSPRPSRPIAGVVAGLQELSNATIPEPSATGLKGMGHFIAGITSFAAIPSPDSELSKSPETGNGEHPFPSGPSLH
jgi:uncharacterized phage protein (TIGR02220 family)